MSEASAQPGRKGSVARAVELAFPAALVLFSVFFIWQSMLVNEPPRNIVVGPRTFPLMVGGLMLAVSALLLWRGLRDRLVRSRPSAAEEAVVPLENEETAISDWTAVWIVIAALVALFLLLEPLGFVISMTLFLFGLSTLFSQRHWLRNLIAAVLFSAFFYFLFTQLLDVPLPQGLMFVQLDTALA